MRPAASSFDLPALIAANKLVIDHVAIDPAEITETGEYSLDGLFIRLLGAARRSRRETGQP